jgi:hypothetical protein
MGCGDACPIFPGKRYESWDDLDVDDLRPIRDEIEARVLRLLNELDAPQLAAPTASGPRGVASLPTSQRMQRRYWIQLR